MSKRGEIPVHQGFASGYVKPDTLEAASQYEAIGICMETPPYTAEKVYLAMQDAGIVS